LLNRRELIRSASALLLAPGVVRAAGYPERPIRMVVAYPPGGVTDNIGRVVGIALSKRLGQQVLVDNRPGGNTLIATQYVTRAPADGYTIYCTYTIPYTILPHAMKRFTAYDGMKDYSAIAMLGVQRNGLIVRADSPYRNAKQFFDAAKANPGKLTYGSPGTAQIVTLVMELLKARLGADVLQVPYSGGAPAFQALLAGQIDSVYLDISTAAPYIKAGQLRMLATAGKQRIAGWPEIPTFEEAGLPVVDLPPVWFGIVGPPGMPPDVVSKLNEAINVEVQHNPEIAAYFAQQSIEKQVMSPPDVDRRLKEDYATWGEIIKRLAVTIE
jgi:tripartite-type tricarboxylate transporter receptor subunit TctC